MEYELPTFLTIMEILPECEPGCGCETPEAIAITPNNGPYGNSIKGFRLWVEFFPS